ncbi:hypothetical protein HPB50_005956 [Hyalomma asiaticum]|uniref:Uncharacterized protein n=1 Tax=Hyalomma asiaticum TaxID=266040 RepID=A0ACB7RLE8_HYAAI|nr:hypothetical protein HPB50_005956 [Hyalomma asiaticum]
MRERAELAAQRPRVGSFVRARHHAVSPRRVPYPSAQWWCTASCCRCGGGGGGRSTSAEGLGIKAPPHPVWAVSQPCDLVVDSARKTCHPGCGGPTRQPPPPTRSRANLPQAALPHIARYGTSTSVVLRQFVLRRWCSAVVVDGIPALRVLCAPSAIL